MYTLDNDNMGKFFYPTYTFFKLAKVLNPNELYVKKLFSVAEEILLYLKTTFSPMKACTFLSANI